MRTEQRSRNTVAITLELPLSVSIELDRCKADRLESGTRVTKSQLIVEATKQTLNEDRMNSVNYVLDKT
jgi:hypothetical protein